MNVWCKRTIWIFEIVLFFLIIYLRPTSFFYFRLILLFVEKVDYRVDFYKNISDSPEDIKDERIPNKIIK